MVIKNRYCRKCGVKLINNNWYDSNKKHRVYLCNNCSNKKNHASIVKYRTTEKGKNAAKEAWSKWYVKNRNKKIEYLRNYRKTEHGKNVTLINSAKCRGLGFTKLFDNPFSENEKYVWHHIDNEFVVAIPEYIHNMYHGKNHKELCMNVITQIYLYGCKEVYI